MEKFESIVGLQIDSLVCIGQEDIINNKKVVYCKCVECGMLQPKNKRRLVYYLNHGELPDHVLHLTCDNKYCTCHRYKTKAEDEWCIGSIHGSYKIIEKIDKKNVVVRCTHCGDTLKISIFRLKGGKSFCRNKECPEYREVSASLTIEGRRKYIKGNIYNDLELMYQKDGRYFVRCAKCGYGVFKVKDTDLKSGKHCKNKDCVNYPVKGHGSISPLVGKVYNNLECVAHTNNCIKVRCKLCGNEFVVEDKGNYINGLISCTNESCINSKVSYRCSLIGKVYEEFTIVGIENGKYKIKCNICGKTQLSDSTPVRKICSFHPRKYKNQCGVFNNLKIITYEYTYNDLEYFICSCQKCGKRDILNVRQMLEHRCEDK